MKTEDIGVRRYVSGIGSLDEKNDERLGLRIQRRQW